MCWADAGLECRGSSLSAELPDMDGLGCAHLQQAGGIIQRADAAEEYQWSDSSQSSALPGTRMRARCTARICDRRTTNRRHLHILKLFRALLLPAYHCRPSSSLTPSDRSRRVLDMWGIPPSQCAIPQCCKSSLSLQYQLPIWCLSYLTGTSAENRRPGQKPSTCRSLLLFLYHFTPSPSVERP